MKKRTLITILITAIVVFLTNKAWLDFKPMTVDFDISGKGFCNIEVQLNKKFNDEFNKIKSLGQDINLYQNNHVSYIIPRSKFPKKVRFVFKYFSDNNPVEIKNITLKNGKYKIEDLNQFSLNEGKLSIENNTLIITPPLSRNEVILTYNKKLHLRTSCKFDVKIFLIISVLTFLLFFKLTNYLADFKTIKKESRIDIIFLTAFFILLFIPLSHIDKAQYSLNENRALKNFEPLINENGAINYEFGKSYNEWFNDRFNLRQLVLNLHTYIKIYLTGKAQKGIIDKCGFLYRDFEVNHLLIKKAEEKDYEALIKFDEYCKQHNIELYLLIVPDIEYVYKPQLKLLINDDKEKIINENLKKLSTQYDINIINPINALKDGTKNGYMYFMTEHHWTLDGAYIGYKELMKEIKKAHNDIYILKETDFNFSENTLVNADWEETYKWGSTSYYIHLPQNYIKKLHKVKYRYFSHKNSYLLKKEVIDIAFRRTKKYNYPEGADYRVILLGTSMSENLCMFIPYTFKNVLRLRNNNVKNISVNDEFKIIKYHEKEILDYKPNIIIFCVTYNNLCHLQDLFNMN